MEGDIILAPISNRAARNPFSNFLKNHWFILFNLTIIIIILVLFIFKILRSSTLEILVTPSDATIIINDKTYKNGSYLLPAGEITAKISADDFDEKEIKLTLENNSTTRLYVFLTGEENDFSYYETHPEEIETLKKVGKDSDLVQDFLSKYEEKEDLKKFLPINYTNNSLDPDTYINLSISYETEKCKTNSYCILISETFSGNYDFAVSLFEKYGYKAKDYEIIYEYTCEKGDTEKCYRI